MIYRYADFMQETTFPLDRTLWVLMFSPRIFEGGITLKRDPPIPPSGGTLEYINIMNVLNSF